MPAPSCRFCATMATIPYTVARPIGVPWIRPERTHRHGDSMSISQDMRVVRRPPASVSAPTAPAKMALPRRLSPSPACESTWARAHSLPKLSPRKPSRPWTRPRNTNNLSSFTWPIMPSIYPLIGTNDTSANTCARGYPTRKRPMPRSSRAWIRASATSWNGSTTTRSEEHTSELQSLQYLVCRLLLEKKKVKTDFFAGEARFPLQARSEDHTAGLLPRPYHLCRVLVENPITQLYKILNSYLRSLIVAA